MHAAPGSTRRLAGLLIAAALFVACGDDPATPAASSGATTVPASTDPAATDSAATDPAVDDTVAEATTVPETSPTTDPPEASVAHIRGTAYTFNTPDPIAGATIGVEGMPDIAAVTGADGSYELAVPAGGDITLFIEAADHFGIRTQTFTLDEQHDGLELDGVNFQTPSMDIYNGLKALIGGFVGRDPFEGGCVIVTTVGDPRMVGMSFDEFIEFHPHGIAGATVTIEPALAAPIYFNDSVVPDQAQLTSSGDGGVLFANVPPGEYTLAASHPDHEFTTVHITCETGWVVNANPVWGLHATS